MKLRRLGDTVLWTSALHALREWNKEAQIDLVVPAAYQSLFDVDPRFANCFGLPAGKRAYAAMARKLRQQRYDLALVFHASSRSAWLGWLCGARKRIVHHHSAKARLYGSQVRVPALGKRMAAVERDANVVRALGWEGDLPPSRLFLSTQWVDDARERLYKAINFTKPVVVLGLEASRPAKVWPLEKYTELAARLGAVAHVIGIYQSPQSFEGRQALVRRFSRYARLIRTPTLAEAAGILAHATCYAGSDSGLKHLAVALDVPTVTFFGPESVGEWHGYDPTRHPVLQVSVGCRDNDADIPEFSWCGVHRCPLSSHACMYLIEVEKAAETIQDYL